ncbi:4a-hydroxytetrahydrobiopterin dehydratase [Bradyrhizobium genosp. P]|uniref:4a-hydroxytetrahydrobiopterin dehydratase n=1 Tax=Bradyrhizobium genosp. P TaxID=83641 RepID=UPI003CF253A0
MHQQTINSYGGRTAASEDRSNPHFQEALDFVQEVTELAETDSHHPEIRFSWGYPTVSLSTDKLKGLPVKHHGEWLLDRLG